MIGQTFNQYKIIEKLSEGGMGVIYLAEDTSLRRKVALKLLPPFLTADEEANRNFRTEAQLVASLNHPNIITIYEINSYKGQHYLSLEYLEGETLRERLKNHPENLSVETILDIALQICSGLGKAHNAGIIHGDIKPENIFINKDNIVKILDFGVSRLIGSSSTANEEKNIFGTTLYMSPEQVQGNIIDKRTDIWSLGVMLYEMISGEKPFKGDYEQSVIYSILNEEPPALKNKSAVPGEIEKIIFKCLKKSSGERYGSAEDVSAELRSVQKKMSRNLLRLPEPGELKNLIDSLSKPSAELYKPSQVFVGREQQLEFLRKKIEEIYKEKGSAVFVQGEPGIGKTQLVYQAVSNTPGNVNILTGRCLFNEGGLPYHPFSSAVKSAYSITSSVESYFINALNKYAGKLGIGLSVSLPFIKAFLGFSEEHISLLNKEQLWNAILILYRIISVGEPLILIIDDLQWADRTTLGLFTFIARNCGSLPLLLIGIHRPPEFSTVEMGSSLTLAETIRQLKIEGAADQIKLERFSIEETRLQLAKLLGAPAGNELLEYIFKNTEGNPLFVSELLFLMQENNFLKKEENEWKLKKSRSRKEKLIITERVQDVIHRRIDRLNTDLREILEAAACQGEYFETEPLAACVKAERLSLLKKLSIIEKEHRLISYEKNRYKFDHILIKEVLYANILFELRQEYHKLLAEYLIDRYGGKEEYASLISRHLLLSGNEEKAPLHLLKAADRARELHAAEDAAGFYMKALEVLGKAEQPELRLRVKAEEGLGDIYMLMGNTDSAAERYNNFLQLTQKSGNKAEQNSALRKISEVFRIQGKIKEASDLCYTALKTAEENNDKEELMHCLDIMSRIHSSKGEYSKAIELSKQSLEIAKELNDLKNQSISLSSIGFAYWHMGIYPSAMEYLNQAHSIQRSIGDNLGLSITLNILGMVYWKSGRYEDALRTTFESLNIKKVVGDSGRIPGTLNVIGDIYREVNEINRAIEFHSRSLTLAKEHQNKGAVCDNTRDLGEDYYLLGETDTALHFFEDTLKLSKDSGLVWYETRAYISLSELFNLTGDKDKALYYSNLGLEYANRIQAKDLIIETLWNQAKVKAGSEGYDEIRKLFLVAIEIAESVSHMTFLWKLYKDYSSFLKDNSKDFEAGIYKNKSRETLGRILENLYEDLKKSFMGSAAVRELMD